ncbi:MAG: ABC transporter ATP-binding protein, partial [Proteobacteria bacterium]|nr:ABC transporter ATP-binding protein [Pseudomonadota bacterium]
MSAVVLQTRDLVRTFGGFVAIAYVDLSGAAGGRH